MRCPCVFGTARLNQRSDCLQWVAAAAGEMTRRSDVAFGGNNQAIRTRKAMEAAFAN
jgi:hypothetical protein